MIEAKNICFSYGAKQILKNIDFKAEKGELVGIIGPNGCGKTTFLRLLSRMSTPEVGTLSLDGVPLGEIPHMHFARQVSFFSQTRPVPDMTVSQLVACGRYPYGGLQRGMTAADRAAVAAALQKTELEALAERNVKSLSGGERQRAYFAMLLAQDTPCMLLDEPAAHMDVGRQLDMMRLLRDAADEGRCVVTVLHELSLALDFCHRIVAMENGRIVGAGTPAELVKNDTVSRLFGVDCRTVTLDGALSYLIRPKQK
jgi:iron complex transport system ATP-binding protein